MQRVQRKSSLNNYVSITTQITIVFVKSTAEPVTPNHLPIMHTQESRTQFLPQYPLHFKLYQTQPPSSFHPNLSVNRCNQQPRTVPISQGQPAGPERIHHRAAREQLAAAQKSPALTRGPRPIARGKNERLVLINCRARPR